jgi:hypothetical protein
MVYVRWEVLCIATGLKSFRTPCTVTSFRNGAVGLCIFLMVHAGSCQYLSDDPTRRH